MLDLPSSADISVPRSRKMSVRLGATTKTWDFNKYRDGEDTWRPGRSVDPTNSKVKDEHPGPELKEEHLRSRRHATDPQHHHSMTPSRSEVKEEPETSHVPRGNRDVSPQSRTEANEEANEEARSWCSLPGLVLCIAVFGIAVWVAASTTASGSDPQPPSSGRSVLQSHDLAVAKSHVYTVSRALNRPPSGLTLDDAGGQVAFDQSRSAVLDLASKISRGSQQIDLLGSFLGRELCPSIKTTVHTHNCSRIASTRPIAQAARIHFRNACDSLNEILSAHDHAIGTLRAYRSDIQQALDHADKKARQWYALLGREDDQEAGGDRRRLFAERTTWWDTLDTAIDELSAGREIVRRKINKYNDSSAGLDVLVQTLDEMAGREGLTRLHCGISEAEGIERQFKEVVARAASDDEGRSFEEYYDAL